MQTDNEETFTGMINDQEVDMVVDTGAQITIVTGPLVYHDQLTGKQVPIVGILGIPTQYELANVPITLDGSFIEETVAVAPEKQLHTRVFISGTLKQKQGRSLAKIVLTDRGAQLISNLTAAVQIAAIRKQPHREAKNKPQRDSRTSDSVSDIPDEYDRASDSSFYPSNYISSSEDESQASLAETHAVDSTITAPPVLPATEPSDLCEQPDFN